MPDVEGAALSRYGCGRKANGIASKTKLLLCQIDRGLGGVITSLPVYENVARLITQTCTPMRHRGTRDWERPEEERVRRQKSDQVNIKEGCGRMTWSTPSKTWLYLFPRGAIDGQAGIAAA